MENDVDSAQPREPKLNNMENIIITIIIVTQQ